MVLSSLEIVRLMAATTDTRRWLLDLSESYFCSLCANVMMFQSFRQLNWVALTAEGKGPCMAGFSCKGQLMLNASEKMTLGSFLLLTGSWGSHQILYFFTV